MSSTSFEDHRKDVLLPRLSFSLERCGGGHRDEAEERRRAKLNEKRRKKRVGEIFTVFLCVTQRLEMPIISFRLAASNGVFAGRAAASRIVDSGAANGAAAAAEAAATSSSSIRSRSFPLPPSPLSFPSSLRRTVATSTVEARVFKGERRWGTERLFHRYSTLSRCSPPKTRASSFRRPSSRVFSGSVSSAGSSTTSFSSSFRSSEGSAAGGGTAAAAAAAAAVVALGSPLAFRNFEQEENPKSELIFVAGNAISSLTQRLFENEYGQSIFCCFLGIAYLALLGHEGKLSGAVNALKLRYATDMRLLGHPKYKRFLPPNPLLRHQLQQQQQKQSQ